MTELNMYSPIGCKGCPHSVQIETQDSFEGGIYLLPPMCSVAEMTCDAVGYPVRPFAADERAKSTGNVFTECKTYQASVSAVAPVVLS